MAEYLGEDGVVVVYGGSSDYAISPASLLGDLWAFCLSNHTWVQLTPIGQSPPAMAGHAMAVYGSQVGGRLHHVLLQMIVTPVLTISPFTVMHSALRGVPSSPPHLAVGWVQTWRGARILCVQNAVCII